MADLSPQDILRIYQIGRNAEWRYRLGQYSDQALGQMLATLNKAKREILAVFESRYATIPEWTADRLESVLFELDDLTVAVRRRLGQDIGDAAGWAGSHAADWHMATLTVEGAASASLFNNVALSPEQVRSFFVETPLGGRLIDEWVARSFSSSVQEAIRAEMNAGVLLGEGYPGIVRRLTQGLDVFSRREAVTLARTYIQAANVEAQRQVFEANRDVVRGWIWQATIDNRTCLLCAALDGREYGWDEPHPPMPRHPRCRCLRRPKTITWRELGIDLDELEQAARPYTVRDPGSIDEGGKRTIREVGFHKGDFASWFEKQPESVQVQIVGPGRLELIRQGKAGFRELVDGETGRLRRIEEL